MKASPQAVIEQFDLNWKVIVNFDFLVDLVSVQVLYPSVAPVLARILHWNCSTLSYSTKSCYYQPIKSILHVQGLPRTFFTSLAIVAIQESIRRRSCYLWSIISPLPVIGFCLFLAHLKEHLKHFYLFTLNFLFNVWSKVIW